MPLTVVAPLAPAAAQTTDADLDQVVGALRAIGTMTADFTQTDRNGKSVRGVLTLKRPGRIRFEYEKGVNMLLVSDGHALTLVDYDVKQVQRWPIGSSPLGALLDPNRDVKKFGHMVPTGNPNVLSIQVKDPKRPEFGVITLIFVEERQRARRLGAGQLGRARFAEPAHHGSAVEPTLRRRGF